MKVFIVMVDGGVDGSFVVSAHRTKEGAKARKLEKDTKYPGRQYWIDDSLDLED